MITLTPQAFIAKWKLVTVSERSSAQQHFLDLCDLLGHPKPLAVDPGGDSFTFEKGVHTTSGKKGWADVWKKGFFAWEYKRKKKHSTLLNAYQQLLLYREDLLNPPLLIVSDIGRIEIHTNFTGTAKQVYQFSLLEMGEPKSLEILRNVFFEPEKLKPGRTRQFVTEEVARCFSGLVDSFRTRGVPLRESAKFLMKLMFCMFAEGIELLSGRVFTRLLKNFHRRPKHLARQLQRLFKSMAKGGAFGADRIPYFNGGMFADFSSIELTADEAADLLKVNECDWSEVEPSIFGTLLERTLDPEKRDQVGTHYTGKEDILAVLHPVLLTPLQREWQVVRKECDDLWARVQENINTAGLRTKRRKPSKEKVEFDRKLLAFAHRLSQVKILDPACGSGNFLYVAMNLLLDLQKEVVAYGASRGLGILPFVRPGQLHGIENHPYAQELAQVVIWIGYLQWKWQNGFSPMTKPVLDPGEGIRLMDAVLDRTDPEHPKEPDWPECDFIVGNPPFLGGSKVRGRLGDSYTDALFRVYNGRVPGSADLCCYWFEKARRQIKEGKCRRAGLLATQSIRGGASREVLRQIKASGDIFFGVSDRDWILDGANVHVSMVGFDTGEEKSRALDGRQVMRINADLTSAADVSGAKPLRQNMGIWCYGSQQKADFDIPPDLAMQMLAAGNPHGRPNSDVVKPSMNGAQILRRTHESFVIDFGLEEDAAKAALYEQPFEHVRKHIYPVRQSHQETRQRKFWWLHARPSPRYREALRNLPRYLATPCSSKHRVFVWMDPWTLVDHAAVVFPRSDDYFFGLLHSRVHELWTRAQGTQVRERESGFRYTATTCFETFPFPKPTHGQRAVIAEAAAALNALRNTWLNQPEWVREEIMEFRASADGAWARYVCDADPGGVGTARFPRLIPKDADCAERLAGRTLTDLYNERPTWLSNAHRELDEAVFAGYGWKADMRDDQVLAELLELNIAAASQVEVPTAGGALTEAEAP